MKENNKLSRGSLTNSQEINNFNDNVINNYPQVKLVPFTKDLNKTKKRLGYVLTELEDTTYLSYECDNDHHTIILHNDIEEIEYITDHKETNKLLQTDNEEMIKIPCKLEEQIIYDYSGELLVNYTDVIGDKYHKTTDLILLDNEYYIGRDYLKNKDDEQSKYYLISKENLNEITEISFEDYNNLIMTYNIKSHNMFLKSDVFSIKNPDSFIDVNEITLKTV